MKILDLHLTFRWYDFKNDISVIGNKYENPELIKQIQ